MYAATIKSPLIPLFFKGGIFSWASNPSLEKHALSQVEGRGRGDFCQLTDLSDSKAPTRIGQTRLADKP